MNRSWIEIMHEIRDNKEFCQKVNGEGIFERLLNGGDWKRITRGKRLSQLDQFDLHVNFCPDCSAQYKAYYIWKAVHMNMENSTIAICSDTRRAFKSICLYEAVIDKIHDEDGPALGDDIEKWEQSDEGQNIASKISAIEDQMEEEIGWALTHIFHCKLCSLLKEEFNRVQSHLDDPKRYPNNPMKEYPVLAEIFFLK